jgi:ligand-binding sensor protein
MARSNRICSACLEVQRKLTKKIGDRSRTVTCFAGLSDSAVPIRIGDQLIGFLQMGKQSLTHFFNRIFRKIAGPSPTLSAFIRW